MLAHDGFDGFSRFVGMVEGYGRDVVMKDVSFDNAME